MTELDIQQTVANARRLEIEIRMALGMLRQNTEDLCEAIRKGDYFSESPGDSGS